MAWFSRFRKKDPDTLPSGHDSLPSEESSERDEIKSRLAALETRVSVIEETHIDHGDSGDSDSGVVGL